MPARTAFPLPGVYTLAVLVLAACAPEQPAQPSPVFVAAHDERPAGADPGADPGAGPDQGAALAPPSRFHGNWRLTARDDRADAALMAFGVQLGQGERVGSGDYVLFQPFCDAVAGVPVSGVSECELIGQAGLFEAVRLEPPDLLVLEFRPTADGELHALRLHTVATGTLAGEYRACAGGASLAVVATDVADAMDTAEPLSPGVVAR